MFEDWPSSVAQLVPGMEEFVNPGDCRQSEKEPGNICRMVSDSDSAITHPSHEVEVARWHTLELMILEERACRMKDVEDIREILARMPQTESAPHCSSNMRPGFQLAGDELVKNNAQLQRPKACSEACEGPSSANHKDMEAFNGFISDLIQNFVSRVQEVESKLQAQAERQMSLLEDGLDQVHQQMATMEEEVQVRMESMEAMSPSNTASCRKESPVGRNKVLRQSSAGLYEKCTLAETARSSKAILLQTPVLQSREPGGTPRPTVPALTAVPETLQFAASSNPGNLRSPVLQSRDRLNTSRSSLPSAAGSTAASNRPAMMRSTIPGSSYAQVFSPRFLTHSLRSTMPAGEVSSSMAAAMSSPPVSKTLHVRYTSPDQGSASHVRLASPDHFISSPDRFRMPAGPPMYSYRSSA